MSPFIYLLNAMERAAMEKNPSKAGYAERRAEVLRYVEELEEKLARLQQEQHDGDKSDG